MVGTYMYLLNVFNVTPLCEQYTIVYKSLKYS